MNFAGIIVIALVALFTWHGWRKGLLAKVSGIAALIVSSLLVSFLLPEVTAAIKKYTPVYDGIVTVCEKTVGSALAFALKSSGISGGDGGGSSVDRDDIRWLMDQAGLDSSQVDYLSDAELEDLIESYFPDYLSSETGGAMGVLDSLSRIDQTKLIRNLPVPDFLQKMILNYNNSAGYHTLGVNTFGDYLIRFIASIILNILTFAVTLAATQAAVWALLSALHVFARIPVLREINHAGGLAIGFLQGIAIVWLLLLVLSLFSGTEPGMRIMKVLDENILLKPLFETNIFLRIVTGAITNIM